MKKQLILLIIWVTFGLSNYYGQDNLKILSYFGANAAYTNYSDIAVYKGRYAFVSLNGTNKLIVIDFNDFSNPKVISEFNSSGLYLRTLSVEDSCLYVCSTSDLEIFNISQPTVPTLSGTWSQVGPNNIIVIGNLGYLAAANAFYILDLTKKSSPKVIGTYSNGYGLDKVEIFNNYAYVLWQQGYATGCDILSLSDLTRPRMLSRIIRGGPDDYLYNIQADNKYAFFTSTLEVLKVYDISDLANPKSIHGYYGSLSFSRGSHQLKLFNNTLYCVDPNRGIVIFDVSDVSNIKLAGNVKKLSNFTAIEINENRLFAVNKDSGVYIFKLDSITAVSSKRNTEPKYYLSNNYPNPFNPSTSIRFSIPEGVLVKLTINDLLGREIKTLVNEYKNSGNYTINFNSGNLPSGVYFYRLDAGGFTQIKKLVIAK